MKFRSATQSLVFCLVIGTAAQGWAQIQFKGRVVVNGKSGSDLTGVILPTDRTARRKFEDVQKLIDEGKYSEVTQYLGEILSGERDSELGEEDVFFATSDADGNEIYRSRKHEALRLLGSLPPEGLKWYRLQFGGRAQKLLDAAVEAGDYGGISEVARRYLHTEAGYKAALLLAQHHLDHGRPLAAARLFQQVLDSPDAQSYEPSLSLTAASTWQRAGQPKKAQQVLAALKTEQKRTDAEVAGSEIAITWKEGGALDWLKRVVGESMPIGVSLVNHWLMYRGSDDRNTACDGGRPLLMERWAQRTVNIPSVERLIEKLDESYRRQEIATLPAMHPLAIGDLVVTRTLQRVIGVDFETGKRVWELRTGSSDDSLERLIKISRNEAKVAQMPQLTFALEQRLWDDAPFGTLASDGERVFVVEGLDLLSPVVSSPSIFVRGAGGDVESPYNTLVALDLKREGYRLWEVGGPDSEVPELAEAFFLGSPLVLSGHLYILAEIKNGVRLVALDPKTGKLLWSQHLVDLERNIDNDPFRRLAGATPSHADGVLVCPISAGVAIAVDLTSRTLLWAYSYEQSFSQNANQMRLMMMRGYPVSQTRKNDRWADGSVTIAKGRVLLTPIESEELHCVNLVSGNLLWKEGRDEGLYIGCVHNDRVIIVQREEVISRDLADGDEQWSLSLPGDSMPSGRGFYSEHFYYLPLTSAEVIKIDLNTGKIVDRSKSRDGSVPGNIICHRGRVLSQNAERLELFFQVETLRAQVEQGIQANPDDAASLTGLAELDLEDGDLDAAIKHLRRSYELVEDVRTRDLLVRCLLDGLRKNFSKYRTAESELESLVVQPDRQIAFLRLMADGHMKAGETIEAFDRYLELARLSNQELEEVATGHEVRSDRWVRSRIVRVLNQASPEARQQMEKQVKQLAAEAIAADSSNELRRFLNHFGEHPTARNVQRELALRLMEIEGAELECELLLFRLAKSEAKAQRAEATALLARHLTENARPADAAKLVERLRDQFADVECLEGKSGNEIAALLAGQLPKSDSAGGAYSYGEVRVKQDSLDTEDRRKLTRTFPLEFRAQRGPFFNDVAIVYDQNQQSVIARDGYGRDLYRVPVNNGNHNSRIFRYVNPNYNLSLAASRGHLLVMSLGTRIVAANTLSDSGMGNRKVLWDAELTEEIPGRTNSFGVRQRSVEVPGRFRRYEATDENNNPVGGLGPVLSTGVYYQSLGDVICVDPLSGETLWIRHDLPQGSTLIGDEEHLIVVPRSGKARVLDPADVSDLALRTAPSESKRMASFGAKVLTHDSSGGKIKLALRDLWEETDLWQHEFNLGAKMWIVDEEAVGIMEPSGHFVLLSLPDGETIIDEKLAAERSLSEIYVLQSSDQFLLITSQPVSEADPDRSFSAAPGGFSDPMINGRIYAFSKASGKPVWATPASVEQMGLLLPQPAELPVLTFVSHVSEKTSGRSRRTVTAVMCLDRRTGRVVFEKEDFPFGTGSYHVEGDPDKDSVELILPGKAVRMTWTGIPVPPEPTEQANLETPEPASGGFFRILGKILGN